MEILKILLIAALSYIIGSILTGEIVARLKQVNIRSQGSGNVGATNVYRSMGSLFGAIVLIGDVLKGIIAVYIGRALGTAFGLNLALVAALMVIIGHNWSMFAHFKGGKGIATSLGVIIALTPSSSIVVLPVWIIAFLLSGYVSLASVLAAVSYPIATVFFYAQDYRVIGLTIILGILAVYRHRGNIHRLIRGEEHRILYRDKRGKKK